MSCPGDQTVEGVVLGSVSLAIRPRTELARLAVLILWLTLGNLKGETAEIEVKFDESPLPWSPNLETECRMEHLFRSSKLRTRHFLGQGDRGYIRSKLSWGLVTLCPDEHLSGAWDSITKRIVQMERFHTHLGTKNPG